MICPDLPDDKLAEVLSFFFNKISNEFTPLSDNDVPRTYNGKLRELLPYQVSGRIRAICKPRTKKSRGCIPKSDG